MPKAALTFDLSEPDDREAHLRATLAGNLYGALWDVAQRLRDRVKHGTDDAKVAITEEIRQEFFSILETHGVDLDNLYS